MKHGAGCQQLPMCERLSIALGQAGCQPAAGFHPARHSAAFVRKQQPSCVVGLAAACILPPSPISPVRIEQKHLPMYCGRRC